MAFDCFIKIGDIKGEAKDHAHKDEIDVLSWSWGVTQPGTMGMGGGGGGGKVNIQDLVFTKYIDTSSTNLYLQCMKIKMEEVMITSMQTGGSGAEDRVTETVNLNFAKVKVEYTPQEATGAAGAVMDIGWDIEANQQL